VAGKNLGKQAIACESARVERVGGGLVKNARPARTCALLAACRDETCLGEDTEVHTGGIHVQADASGQLTHVERAFSVLQDLEDLQTARLAESPVDVSARWCG
jgi:hypothetical protein